MTGRGDTSASEGADRTRSEQQVQQALAKQLLPGEVLMTRVRMTDSRDGDVEADLVVLFPDAGAAVIEVKGGNVRFADGQWTTSNKKYTRRIHPVEQARRAKHSLRRYLDRQPEWNRPLLRCEWFVAMPMTEVVGDMGPEGQRERLIGSNDLRRIREQLREQLTSSLNPDPVPSAGWVDDVVTLLLRADRAAPSDVPKSATRKHAWAIGGAVAGVALALGGWFWLHGATSQDATPTIPASGSCAPGYEPCLPVVADLNCPQIKAIVTVTGADQYGLDRDGDGTACETYG